jgi:phosphohistidine phosphatase
MAAPRPDPEERPLPAPVYLVRHARAEAGGSGGDAARRLTAEGRAAFTHRVATLARRLQMDRIVTSPFRRAVQTATILAEATGAPIEEEAALASGVSTGKQLLALARRLGPGTALVGHNPELGEAIALAAGHAVEVPPGTIAAVSPGGKVTWWVTG